MEKNRKFLSFVAKLEQKMLDSNQESLIFFNNAENLLGGVIINDNSCVNSTETCNGSINGNQCANSSCDNSVNRKRCTSITP